MLPKIILLSGPTASGKTALAIKLACYYPIEIISVDSALIYKDLSIGVAKPDGYHLAQVKHHLIDIISPLENYSVMRFLHDCDNAIQNVLDNGKIPLLVGGTMMYFNAFLRGISQLPQADLALRKELDHDFVSLGTQAMHARLATLDPIAAMNIATNDRQRIERALEVCLLSGKPFSVMQAQSKIAPLADKYNALIMALTPSDRACLHTTINQRFGHMLSLGLVDELIDLRKKYPELTSEHNSMRSVGYSQVWQYLEQQIDYTTMLNSAQAATRQLAKRQLTWLRTLDMFTQIDSSLLTNEQLVAQILDKVAIFLD